MSENVNNQDLDEVFEEEMDDSEVITVPIDDTLSLEGAAADAKAVGDALALKANLEDIVRISVNGEEADNQGVILIDGRHIPVNDDQGAPTLAEMFENLQEPTAENIPMSDEDETTLAEKIAEMEEAAEGCVKSVNGVDADETGNVTLNSVPLAQNLTSDSSQASSGAFIVRTTGGSRSIGSGQAQVQEIRGQMKHTGVVEEVLQLSVEETSGITAEIDRDTFMAEVQESGTITLTYTTGWSTDPATYGVTVEGTPNSGDKITITYVKENRGLITPADPSAFRATGWNLYNPSTGYARVAEYDGAYHIGGEYTSLAFSSELNGERSALTVADNRFRVPGNGYVWVTGGDATTTYITTEWTDWTNGPNVDWAAYSETDISLATIMSTYFPDGLMAVGSVYDAISIDQSRAISRIEKLDYDEETLAELISQGRAYEADEQYIYAVKTIAESNAITISGQFQANDHGIEMIDGTEVGPYVVIIYGQNLKAKLVNDVPTLSQQTLTEAQKKQVQENIGVTELYNNLLGLYITEAKTVYDNKSIAANGYNDLTISMAKAGYKLDGVAGYNIANGSSSGSGRTNVVLTKLYTSGDNLVVCAKNTSGSTVKIKLVVYLRYKKVL